MSNIEEYKTNTEAYFGNIFKNILLRMMQNLSFEMRKIRIQYRIYVYTNLL